MSSSPFLSNYYSNQYNLPTTVLLKREPVSFTNNKNPNIDAAGLRHLFQSQYDIYDKFTLTSSTNNVAYYESSMYPVVQKVTN